MAHPLGHMLDMGRAEAADLEPGANESRLDQRRNRALALGAAHVDRAERLLRVAEPRPEIRIGARPTRMPRRNLTP